MMRRLWMLVSLLVFLMTGCSSSNEEEAMKVGKEFKKTYFNVTDNTQVGDNTAIRVNEQCRKYLTEQKFAKFNANREAALLVTIAKQEKTNIELTSMDFEKVAENKQKGTVEFRYTMKLQLSGNVNKTIEKKGQMTLVKEGNDWKVDSDSDEKLEPGDFR